jgi:transaldolase
MPEPTLLDFADHGAIEELMPADGGDAEATLSRFAQAGIDAGQLATQLQKEGAQAFVDSWNELLQVIDTKSGQLVGAR